MKTQPKDTKDVTTGNVQDVQAMYEKFPYPSPVAGASLIDDVANSFYSLFSQMPLDGKRILDAGCGTGHRLLAVARRYPKSQFVGLDMTSASLEVARSLSKKHNIKNVEFQQSDIAKFTAKDPFDVIMSIGVIHHLENPCLGLSSLSSLLTDRGILVVWLYHALGEHLRLLDREMLLTMWNRADGLERGMQMMRELGMSLETKRYGSSAAQQQSEISQQSIDVDAYLHPIVNAYRFDQAIKMFRDCAKLTWAAINNVNLLKVSKLIDIGEVEQGDMRYFCQTVDETFATPELRQRFRQLSTSDKLRILEIKLAPTGFTIVGGRADAYNHLGARLTANVVTL